MPEISTDDITRLMRIRELKAELSEIENDIDGALLRPIDPMPLGLNNDMTSAPAEIPTLRGQPGAVSEEETFQDPPPLGLDNDMTPPPNDGGSTNGVSYMDIRGPFGMPMTATLNNGKMVNISQKSKMGGAGEGNYSTDADGNVIDMPKFLFGTPIIRDGKWVGMTQKTVQNPSQGQEPTPSQAVSAPPPQGFDDETVPPSGFGESQTAAENHSSMMQELLKGRRGRGIV
tara:strand:- start:3581 stop:4270 length:690 start_codon:yes stop_codon:yes gene_type:complete